jgi:pseudaminic acid cytidylyltransferase
MVLALIPARGGSKRIPRKNVVDIGGKPMIAWTIQTALAAGVFDEVRVTTDCPDIAQVSRDAGARVPHLRDAEVSGDYSTLDAVIRHEIIAGDVHDDWICLIYATAILLRPQTLQRAHALAMNAEPGTDFIMGLCDYPHPPQRAVRVGVDHSVAMVAPENAMTRTQDLEPLYHDAAQFVFGRRSAWMDGRTVWNSPTKGVILSAHEAVDIDTPDDLAMAAALLYARQGDAA